MQGEYLKFELFSSTGLTDIYRIYSKLDMHHPLGLIKWFGAWRKYVFYPSEETCFDIGCLGEICAFINTLMAARVAKRKSKVRKAT